MPEFIQNIQAKVSTKSNHSYMIIMVCGNAYPQFHDTVTPVGGGMEHRAALFGRGLAQKNDWNISFVVSDFDQPFLTRHEGIDFYIYQSNYRRAGRNVFPRFRKSSWFPSLKHDWSDFSLVWQVPIIAIYLALPALLFPRFWRSLKPDVVCCFGNNERSAEVIADCNRQGIKTILCVANDRDLFEDYSSNNLELDHYGMPKWKGHYALTTASCIIVQTAFQQQMLQRNFNRSSVLIRNPVKLSQDDKKKWITRTQREFVLWIGRADAFNKQPSIFLDLAKHCPDLHFLMIVNRTDEAELDSLEADCPDNLRIIEHVHPTKILDFILRARVFVNTSRYEGFPNTFLQCAVSGVPIVSLQVDPDGMLTRNRCGIYVSGDVAKLKEAVIDLVDNSDKADRLANACYQYVLEYHEYRERVAEMAACIEKLHVAEPVPEKAPWWAAMKRYWR